MAYNIVMQDDQPEGDTPSQPTGGEGSTEEEGANKSPEGTEDENTTM